MEQGRFILSALRTDRSVNHVLFYLNTSKQEISKMITPP